MVIRTHIHTRSSPHKDRQEKPSVTFHQAVRVGRENRHYRSSQRAARKSPLDGVSRSRKIPTVTLPLDHKDKTHNTSSKFTTYYYTRQRIPFQPIPNPKQVSASEASNRQMRGILVRTLITYSYTTTNNRKSPYDRNFVCSPGAGAKFWSVTCVLQRCLLFDFSSFHNHSEWHVYFA